MKLLFLIIIFTSSITLLAQNLARISDLRGQWKFSIGDNQEWSRKNFNDNDWETIRVPSSWENQGFHGYDGYAWYRKSFYLPKEFSGRSFVLQLGFIDDIDEVYINGNFIGRSGSFPPGYETAYNEFRRYSVPQKFLNLNNENVVAVRVYDSRLEGGIMNGDIGMYYWQTIIADYNLEGTWKFATGDDPKRSEISYNDKEWKEIVVPSLWEYQGYRNYDGFAWYRNVFSVPENLMDRKLVLLMGKIDDLDAVYINGVMVGSTGDLENPHSGDEYQQFRGYYIPDGLLKENGNIIAVRVYDGYLGGGIYQGPVGLVRQEKYTKFWQSQRKKKNIFEVLFGN
jgi:hypothetical protein